MYFENPGGEFGDPTCPLAGVSFPGPCSLGNFQHDVSHQIILSIKVSQQLPAPFRERRLEFLLWIILHISMRVHLYCFSLVWTFETYGKVHWGGGTFSIWSIWEYVTEIMHVVYLRRTEILSYILATVMPSSNSGSWTLLQYGYRIFSPSSECTSCPNNVL